MNPPAFTHRVIHGLREADYHADRLGIGDLPPSLSSNAGKLLLSHSPLHAWHAHPRLNPDWQPDDPAKFDLGKAVHALLLDDRPERVVIIDAADYKASAAKAARDTAIADGKLPLLTAKYETAMAIVHAARDAIPRFAEGADFIDGDSEVTLVWEEPGGVVCRMRIDRLAKNHTHMFDVKTEGESAHPDAFANKITRLGYDFSAAFYLRGFRKCFPSLPAPQWSWLAIETEPPHGVSLTGMDAAGLAIADQEVEIAIAIWRECLRTGTWPGYPHKKRIIETKPWALASHEQLSARIGFKSPSDSQAIRDMIFKWQAPIN